MDKVKRGEMVRQVRGNGALVPEKIQFVLGDVAGRIEDILVDPGATVTANTVLMILSNPDLVQAVFDAELAVKSAEAQRTQLEVSLETTQLNKEATLAKAKADYDIAETQVKDVVVGQPAEIDTRNGVIKGTVTRIVPAVQNGTVKVEVKLEGSLPPGARPDLSVDGAIELDRLDDVLYVGRPVNGAEDSTVGVFKVNKAEKTAVRVPVRFGRTSVGVIEVREGLSEGDEVILSDMSNYEDCEKVRLE